MRSLSERRTALQSNPSLRRIHVPSCHRWQVRKPAKQPSSQAHKPKQSAKMSNFSTVVPRLLYNDVNKAMNFLVKAFGFEERRSSFGDGSCYHAILARGTGVVELYKRGDNGAAKLDSAGVIPGAGLTFIAVETQAAADALAAAAVLVGGVLVGGNRNTTIRDPEGHFWQLGTG